VLNCKLQGKNKCFLIVSIYLEYPRFFMPITKRPSRIICKPYCSSHLNLTLLVYPFCLLLINYWNWLPNNFLFLPSAIITLLMSLPIEKIVLLSSCISSCDNRIAVLINLKKQITILNYGKHISVSSRYLYSSNHSWT